MQPKNLTRKNLRFIISLQTFTLKNHTNKLSLKKKNPKKSHKYWPIDTSFQHRLLMISPQMNFVCDKILTFIKFTCKHAYPEKIKLLLELPNSHKMLIFLKATSIELTTFNLSMAISENFTFCDVCTTFKPLICLPRATGPVCKSFKRMRMKS